MCCCCSARSQRRRRHGRRRRSAVRLACDRFTPERGDFQEPPRHQAAAALQSDEGGSVCISSDTWPGSGGVLGLTKAQIAEAKASGVQPSRVAGFGYMAGARRRHHRISRTLSGRAFQSRAHVQDEPFCAQIGIGKHLNAPIWQARPSSMPLDRGQLHGAARPDPRPGPRSIGDRPVAARRPPRSSSTTWR